MTEVSLHFAVSSHQKADRKPLYKLLQMTLKPEDLTSSSYTLLDSLGHKEIVPFVQTYLKKRTLSSVIYLVSNLAVVAFAVFYFLKNYTLQNFSFDKGFSYFSYGIGLAFVLIPIHEFIHVLAYKSQGADKTSYDANLKRFYFMAIADRFVANRKEFQIVALAPFMSITAALLICLFFTSQLWTLTILGVLLTHTACCSGDFGLLSYFDFHKDKNVVTYDDKENGISYFYAKKEKGLSDNTFLTPH